MSYSATYTNSGTLIYTVDVTNGNVTTSGVIYTSGGNSSQWNSLKTNTSIIQIELPDNKNYFLDAKSSYQYTLSSVYFYALSGSGNASLYIDNVVVPEFNQRTISQTASSVYLTTSNVVSSGQTLTLTLSNNNFMYDYIMEVTYTR